jgi:hypothetical protein
VSAVGAVSAVNAVSAVSAVGPNGVGLASGPWNSDTATVRSVFAPPHAVHHMLVATDCWSLLFLRISVNPKLLKQFQCILSTWQFWLL